MEQTEQEPITVVVADDDMRFRQVVAMVLDEEDDISVIAEAADGYQALAECLELVPDVVLLDMNMPGGGIGAVRSIYCQLPTTKIVMLTCSDLEEDIYGALKAGASGYVVKQGFIGDLAEIIMGMTQGVGVFLSASIAGKVLADFGYPDRTQADENRQT